MSFLKDICLYSTLYPFFFSRRNILSTGYYISLGELRKNKIADLSIVNNGLHVIGPV